MDKSIFRAYDIRGVYPDELNEDTAYRIGRAFVTFLGCKKVIVGQDMRKSSPQLFGSLVKGITDQGADVIDIGYCSTPYFYCGVDEHESGVMVTASHNPGKYNGFKLTRDGTVPISGDTGIMDIRDIAAEGKFAEPEKKGEITKKDVMQDFINHNMKFLDPLKKKFKIVIDTGNGMGGYTFPKVMKKVENLEVVPLFFDVDMSFPNHEANPIKLDNVKEIMEKVPEVSADFGIAVDGDCDRCFFIDEKGEYISADLMTALIAETLLKKHKGAHILYDLRSSWTTKEVIEENGGTSSMCRVGHAFIKGQMRKEDALFAGELSGHLYFKESFVAESSIIATFMVINLLQEKGKTLSELLAPLRRYHASGEINSEVQDKEGVMKKLEGMFKEKAKVISHLDGIKLEFDDWWFNVRASNTEPKLRLNLEAKTKDKMEEMRDKILAIIRA